MKPNLRRVAAPWFQCYRPVLVASARLVCFPHAGGGASFFRPWVDDLPAGIELFSAQYPGREDRLTEPFASDIRELSAGFAQVLTSASDLPLVLFGHSLGAAIAYEVAGMLQAEGQSPSLLVVSGRQEPFDPSRLVHLMDDDSLWADVAKAGGTAQQVLESPEIKAMMLPVLRADYRLSETYRPSGNPLLKCPVLAVSGDKDADVDLAVLPKWGELTEADFDIRVFEGDHFYLKAKRSALIGEISRRLRQQTSESVMP